MTDTAELKRALSNVYGKDGKVLKLQLARWKGLLTTWDRAASGEAPSLFSTPGRTEIAGNHTDHNHGKVLAASVNLDSIACAAATADGTITVLSEGYKDPFVVRLDSLRPVVPERGTTSALIRGTAARFRELGHAIGGFRAAVASDVLVGSGLSSSASIEVLIGTILSSFYNRRSVDLLTLAKIGQYAENVYFGKPCGLMDQIACSVGGIVTIDFNDPQRPKVRKVECDFSRAGYSLLVVDTGGNHADLTEDYASIPREMKAVAGRLGKEYCRDITERELLSHMKQLRRKLGDRAVLRALHFLHENERVDRQVSALRRKDFSGFLALVSESGNSSFRWLQNCYSPRTISMQGIPLALAMTERYLKKSGRQGAARVHGGGFAGTIQVFLPKKHVPAYVRLMESVFTPGCVKRLEIRTLGTTQLI